MLSLTRKTDYALVALASLAMQAPVGASANELARRLNLPLAALRNILKRLAQHGLVASTQGAAGGYRLARPAEQITLAEVVHAVQGPVRLTLCCPADSVDSGGHHLCRLEDGCRIKATVRTVHQRLVQFLDQVNLAQIAAGEVGQAAALTSEAQRSRAVEMPRQQPALTAIEK